MLTDSRYRLFWMTTFSQIQIQRSLHNNRISHSSQTESPNFQAHLRDLSGSNITSVVLHFYIYQNVYRTASIHIFLGIFRSHQPLHRIMFCRSTSQTRSETIHQRRICFAFIVCDRRNNTTCLVH